MIETRQYKMTDRDLISVNMLIGAVVQVISFIFFGNWLDLDLILYLGIICLGISLVLFLSSNLFKKDGGKEPGKGFVTTKLVDSGIYGVIRHPIYLSLAYLFIGFALISQYPLSLFFGFTMALCCYYFMIEEEKLTIEKFGEEYLRHMKKISRSNLLIGIWRIFRRKDT